MGVCSIRVLQEEMGLIDGRQRDGLLLGQKFISYFQIESALLEYPGVAEAGVIADCVNEHDPGSGQILKVFLALDSNESVESLLPERVIEFIRQRFAIMGPVRITLKDKLPMTRSGKILRSILNEWN